MRSKVRPMNELLHSLSLRANQNQWQCENARSRLSGKFPYDMKGVSAVPPRETNCLGEAAAPEFTVSKIGRGTRRSVATRPHHSSFDTKSKTRCCLGDSDGWIMNGWKDGLAGLPYVRRNPQAGGSPTIWGKRQCTVIQIGTKIKVPISICPRDIFHK